MDNRLTIVFSGFLLLIAGCGKDAPVWDGNWDGSPGDDTGEPDTGVDTGNDTAVDTAVEPDTDTTPEVLPPGVAAATPGTISTIDGQLTESVWNVSVPVTHTIEGSGNNNVLFGALWDNFFLYVGVYVDDPNLKDDSEMIWQDDSVEIFIDADYNRGTTYDMHDFQYWLAYGSNTLTVTYGQPLNAKHSLTPFDGGYTAELAVPWDDMQVTPSAGMQIGFDVGINDDDDGDGRDAHYMWNGNDNNWKDTSAFGTLILQ